MKHWVYSFLIVLLFSGCSVKELTPKVYKYPAWYDKKPSSELYYYGIGEASTIKGAKDEALKMIIDEILTSVDENLSVPVHFASVRVVELIEHKANVITLISVEKEGLFERNYKDLTIFLRRIEKMDEGGSDEFIVRYVELKRRLEDLKYLDKRIHFLQIVKPSFNGESLKKEYSSYINRLDILRQAIRIQIHSDFESISLVESFSKALKEENIQKSDKASRFVSDYRVDISAECVDESMDLTLKLFNFEDTIIASSSYTITCKDSDEMQLAFDDLLNKHDIFSLLGL